MLPYADFLRRYIREMHGVHTSTSRSNTGLFENDEIMVLQFSEHLRTRMIRVQYSARTVFIRNAVLR